MRPVIGARIVVYAASPDTVDLETVFLELTKDQGVGD